MRRSGIVFFLMAVYVALMGFLLLFSHHKTVTDQYLLRQRAELVQRLGLTDLALFTEARYTRHLSQADLHTPFQDHPFAMEHFPTGSLLEPPDILKGKHHGDMD